MIFIWTALAAFLAAAAVYLYMRQHVNAVLCGSAIFASV